MATLLQTSTDPLARGSETQIDKIFYPPQPDIAYHPDRQKWQDRSARRLQADSSLLSTPLPTGFPLRLESPLVWDGSDWKDEKEWVYQMSVEELNEIDIAVNHFKSLNLSLGHLSPSTFPLPTLGPALANLSRELHQGRGFFVLRTLPVDSYSRADNVIIYTGVSSYVGALRGLQDEKNGDVLAHIKDLSNTNLSIGAPAHTTDPQGYHTDAGDIISLFALDVAVEGGISRISSGWTVYNELVENRPDLIKTLAEPWPFDTFGAEPKYNERPLIFYQDSKIIIQYARRLFTGYMNLPRSTGIPPITEAQAEALDALHFLAEKHALGLNFQKGDIQYINNFSIFHARDGFRDSPEHTRHLLRFWLRNEDLAWELPPELKNSWKKLYYEVRGDDQKFPLEPEVCSASKGDVEDQN